MIEHPLAGIQSDIDPIREKLFELWKKYRDIGEGRIAHEITNAIRALDETLSLAQLYVSESPLPTLQEMHGILQENNLASLPKGLK